MEENPLIKIKKVGQTEEFFRLQTFRSKLAAAGHSPAAIAAFTTRLQTEFKITTEKGTTYEIMIMEEKPPKRRKISKPCEACDGTGRTKLVFADCPYCNGTGKETR
jgi:DnaJ-class molecular chaperone